MKVLSIILFLLFASGEAFSQSNSSTAINRGNTTQPSSTVVPNTKGGLDVIINQPPSSSGNQHYGNSKGTNSHPSNNATMHPKKNQVEMSPIKSNMPAMGKPNSSKGSSKAY